MDDSTRDTIIWACFGLSAIQALGVPLHFFNITWDSLVSHRGRAVTIGRSENRFPRFLFAGCILSTTVGVSVFLYGRHPLWLVTIIVIAGALILAAFLAGRRPEEPKESPPREFEKLADQDSADMSKRLVLCGKTAKLNVETVEPYIDATFKVVNTSMFSVMSEKVEGYASYRGYSGEKCYPSRTPIIADILNVFHLSRGDPGELTLRLYVPPEITDNIAAANDRLEVDFTEVRVYFRFNGTGGNTRFFWLGDVVEVSRLTDENTSAKQLEVELFRCRQIRDGALAEAREAKERIAELETQLAKAVATSDPWLSLLHSRQEFEEELRPLLEIEEAGIKVVPQFTVGKGEGDYRREKIAQLRRDIEEIGKRLVSTQHKGPDITGEILHARRPTRISPYRGHEQSMLLLKLRVSTRTEVATIRRTDLTVESNGKKYEGKKQSIEIEPAPVIFHSQFGRSQEEKPFDLVDRVAKEPLRRAIGTEGWLQFLVDGLPNDVGIADLYLTITDDLGGEHLISAESFSID